MAAAWRMTRDEFEAYLVATGQRAGYGEGHYGVKVAHEIEVRMAIKTKLAVPPIVLEQYPGLQRRLTHQLPQSGVSQMTTETAVATETLRQIGSKWSSGKRISAEVLATGMPWHRLRATLSEMGFVGPSRKKPAEPKAQTTPVATVPVAPATLAMKLSTPCTPQNLVEKYRPRQLSDLLGQGWVSSQLETFLERPYSVAFMFDGNTGTGKTTAAIVLAEALGVVVAQQELGGLHQIASGEQTGESVRRKMDFLRYTPLIGSGWRVLIVNEADAMTQGASQIWLDALENLPQKTVVIFTTNHVSKLPARLRDRCERLSFEASALLLKPALQELAEKIWQGELGISAPDVEAFGVLADDDGNVSFRRLIQVMAPYLRAKQIPVAPCATNATE